MMYFNKIVAIEFSYQIHSGSLFLSSRQTILPARDTVFIRLFICRLYNNRFSVPDPHASNRHRHAAVCGDFAVDAAPLEIQDPWLGADGHAGCGLRRFTVSCCILARHQYVRVFWNLVSTHYIG